MNFSRAIIGGFQVIVVGAGLRFDACPKSFL
jgi:hypothetical protein